MTEEQEETPLAGCVLGVFWKLAGPSAFLAVGISLFLGDSQLGSVSDFIFVGVSLSMIAARMLDPQKLNKPEDKEPGELYLSRGKYVLLVLVVTTTILFLAHFIV